MKETKVYVDKLPECCSGCVCVDGFYCGITQKNIYYEFYEWTKPKDCPLIDIKTHDRELVKEVCEKIKYKLGSIEDILINLGNGKEDALNYFMHILNEIEKEIEK